MVDTLLNMWLSDDMTTNTCTARPDARGVTHHIGQPACPVHPSAVHTITTAANLKVGDTLLAVWGTTLAAPVTVTSVDISPTFGGGVVRHSGGSFIPVRRNDNRPVVIAYRPVVVA